MPNARQKAQLLQKAGKGLSGVGQMVEMATDLLEEPRLMDLSSEQGPAGLGLLSRLRNRFRRKP